VEQHVTNQIKLKRAGLVQSKHHYHFINITFSCHDIGEKLHI